MKEGVSRRLLLSMALAVAWIGTAASPATRESYVYDDLISGQSIDLMPQEGSLGVGESVFDAQFCGAASEFACFESHPYAFAVRKSNACAAGSWTVGGRKYSLTTPLHERYLLGKIQKVCVISSAMTRGDESISGRYLYSPVDGLLVMEFRVFKGAESLQRTFLSRARGFGAPTQ